MMPELCPECGNRLDFEWEEDGVAFECTNCPYKTRPKYATAKPQLHLKIRMDRV
jgi:hypothetical protein